MEINYKKLGKRIQSARKEAGLSQEQLAEAIGKSPSAISTIETGKRGASLETLIRIANALQVSADYLLADQLPHIPGAVDVIALLTSCRFSSPIIVNPPKNKSNRESGT